MRRSELVWPQLHIGAAEVLQAIPERTLEAAAEPLARVVDFDQNVVAHLRQAGFVGAPARAGLGRMGHPWQL